MGDYITQCIVDKCPTIMIEKGKPYDLIYLKMLR